MEQGLAILKAAAAVDAPVILRASRARGPITPRRMVEALAETNPGIPICLHQNHNNKLATCMSAIRHGFTSVMMDGSLHAVPRPVRTLRHGGAGTQDQGHRDGQEGQPLCVGVLDPAITGAKAAGEEESPRTRCQPSWTPKALRRRFVGKLEGDPATTKGYYDIFREDRNPMAQENGSSSNRTGHRSTR
jgi:hypothetical protein